MAADNKTQIILTAQDRASPVIGKVGGALSGLVNPAQAANAALSGLAGGAALLGLGAIAKQAIDAADAMSKMSQRVGVGVEALSKLNYAASLSDVSTESLSNGLKKLSQNIDEAASGAKEQAKAFASIGVAVKDSGGNLRSADAVFADIAARFSSMKDGTEKTAVAMQIFGKAGADLIPLLNSGASGLSDMAEEAKRLGVVIGDDFAQQSAQFNDNLTRIGAASKGVANDIASALLPTVNAATDSFLSARAAGLSFFQALTGIGVRGLGESLAEATAGAGERLNQLRDELGKLEEKRADLEFGDFYGDQQAASDIENVKSLIRYFEQLQLKTIKSGTQFFDARDLRPGADLSIDIRQSAQRTELEKSAEKAAKASAKAYETLIDTLRDKIAVEQLASQSQEKLTSGQQIAAKLAADIAAGQVKLSAAQRVNVDASIAQLIALEKSAVAREKLVQAEKDWTTAVEKANTAARDSVDAQLDRAVAAEQELATYGLTKSAIEDIIIARLEEQVRMTAGLDSQAELVANLEKEIDARKRVAAALRGTEAKDDAKKAAEDAAKAWEKFADDIERSLTDALMRSFESGKGFGESFVDTLKNTLKTTVLKIAVQAIVSPVVGNLQGALGGGGGGAGSLLSNAGNLFNFSQTPALDAFQRFANSQTGASLLTTQSPLGGPQLTQFGSTISQFAEVVDTYGGYVNAAIQLGEGRYGAAAGAALGQYLGGPIGSFIGTQIGGMLDDAFGGGGGPKQQGGFTNIAGQSVVSGDLNTQAKAFATSVEGAFAAIARRYGVGVTTGAQAAISADPEGTALTDLGLILQANGQTVYDRNQAMGGTANVGRSQAELEAAIADSSRDAILSAVAKTDIGGEAVVALFDQFESGLTDLSAERGEALVTALAGGWLNDLVASFEDAAPSLEQVADAAAKLAPIAGLKPLFDELGISFYKLGADVTAALGGTEQAGAALSNFYEQFYTAEEKRASLAEKVAGEFDKLGIAMPATAEGFRDLVEAQDLTTESGRATYAALLKVAPAFKSVADSSAQAAAAAKKQLNDLAKEWTGFDAAGLGRMILDAALNPQAGMTAAESFAVALEESVRNALISSVVGNVANSIYQAIVVPLVAGQAVSESTIAAVTASAQAAINSLAEVLNSLDLSKIIGAIPDLSPVIRPPSYSAPSPSYTSPSTPQEPPPPPWGDAADILNKKLELLAEKFKLTGDAAGAASILEQQRVIALQSIAPELRDLQRELWNLQDAAEATAKVIAQQAANIAEGRARLDILGKIYSLTGDEAMQESVKQQLRTLQLMEMASQGASQELVDLTKWLWQVEDSTAAANKSLAKMKDIANQIAAISTFREGITASQDSIRSQMAGFDGVAFQEARKDAARKAISDATTTQGRIDAGKKLQDAILSGYEAQKAAIEKNRAAAEAAARSVFDAEEAARRKAIESANQLNAAYRNVGEYAKSLLLSAQSPLSGRAKLAAAGSDFNSLLARARGGDIEALGKLQGSGSAFIDQARNTSATAADFGRVFGRVAGSLSELGGRAGKDLEYTTRQFYFDSTAYDEQLTALQTSTLEQLEELGKLTEEWTTDLQEQMAEEAIVFSNIDLSTEQTATLLQGLGPGFESVVTAVNAATAAQADTAAMLAAMQAMQAEISALRQSQAVATAQARRTADAVNGNPEAPMLVETTT